MRNKLILAGVALCFTSCTYDDVVAYLTGKPNNLNEQEKQEVETKKMSNSTIIIDEDINKGDVKPPR